MYSNNILEQEGQEVCVIGKFDRLEDDLLILICAGREVPVAYNSLESYKTPSVCVKGKVENGVLREEYVDKIGDEFDYEMYNRFSKINGKFKELF